MFVFLHVFQKTASYKLKDGKTGAKKPFITR